MFDYLGFIQKIIDISDGNIGFLVICNKDGHIEYCKNWEHPSPLFPQQHMEYIVGKHVLEVYANLTKETSTVMEVLSTGVPILNRKQELIVEGRGSYSFISNTIPYTVDGKILGAIDYGLNDVESLQEKAPKNLKKLYVIDDIITQNRQMERLKEQIRLVSISPSPVLICGETGTGKELVAESIHTMGSRAEKTFLAQNCSAIPANLLESLFFGTEKGSFTGADSRKGLFELSDGGTLFLDEISAMDVQMQAKLLKAIEEKKIRRIGGIKDIPFDVRIISASNEDPELLLAEGRMREDFYYRIGVVQLDIPPLRQRKEDILLLTGHFIQLFNKQMKRQIKGLSEILEQMFISADWPGNVRQLKNIIERAYNLNTGDTIVIDDVPDLLKLQWLQMPQIPRTSGRTAAADGREPARLTLPSRTPERFEAAHTKSALPQEILSEESLDYLLDHGGIDLDAVLATCEEYLIRKTITQTRQFSKAAQKLSISPQKLQYKLNKYGLRDR